MTFDDLKYFFEIARSGNFSRAASNLNITQPNLTKHISRLEAELGIVLFDRSTHHCRLTEEGALFMHRTEDLFFDLRSAIEDTRMRSKNQYRQLFIGLASGERPNAPVYELIQKLNTESPSHRYILLGDSYSGLIEKLYSHEYDMIITADRNARYAVDFESLKLERMQLMLAVPRSNPKSENPNLTPKDCTDEIVFLSLPDGKHAPPSRIGDFSRRAGVSLNLLILPSPSDLIECIRTNAGVAILPNIIDTERYPDIAFFEYEPPRGDMWLSLIWRRDETNPAVHDFVRRVREIIPDYSDVL